MDSINQYDADMFPTEDGDYVRYEDYAVLQQKYEDMRTLVQGQLTCTQSERAVLDECAALCITAKPGVKPYDCSSLAWSNPLPVIKAELARRQSK